MLATLNHFRGIGAARSMQNGASMTQRLSLHLPLFSALALLASACNSDFEPAAPDLGGKSDSFSQVNQRGILFFDEAQVHHISADFQFDGFRIELGRDSEVSFETTHLGSSRGFDTTLFVYGPKNPTHGYGQHFIAMDDNSGFGPLSKLSNLNLEAGEYLVVVGTPDALGRGRYRLQASCLSDDCETSDLILTSSEEESILDALNEECVMQSCDGGFTWSATEVRCNFTLEECTLGFLAGRHEFEDPFSDSKVGDAIGSSQGGDSFDGRPFVATLRDSFDDEEGTLLDIQCRLGGYKSAARILEFPHVLSDDFQDHLLDCIFTLEDMMHELVE